MYGEWDVPVILISKLQEKSFQEHDFHPGLLHPFIFCFKVEICFHFSSYMGVFLKIDG
jgi:hypothetical protein